MTQDCNFTMEANSDKTNEEKENKAEKKSLENIVF